MFYEPHPCVYTVYLCSMNPIPVCTWIYCVSMLYEPHPFVYMDILYIYVLWTTSLCAHRYTVYLCSMNHIPVCTWMYCISMFYEPHPCVHMDILYIYVLWTTSLFAHGYNVYPQHSHVSSGYRECHQPEGVPVARWDQRFQQHSQQKLCRGTSEQASDQSPIHQVTTARLTIQLNNQWKINKSHHLTLNTQATIVLGYVFRSENWVVGYPVGEVLAEPGVAAEPLVWSFITLLDDVAGDHAASITSGGLPEEGHSSLGLLTVVQVQRRTWPLWKQIKRSMFPSYPYKPDDRLSNNGYIQTC